MKELTAGEYIKIGKEGIRLFNVLKILDKCVVDIFDIRICISVMSEFENMLGKVMEVEV